MMTHEYNAPFDIVAFAYNLFGHTPPTQYGNGIEGERAHEGLPLSIAEQFDISCEVGEGDIICPDCGVEIGQFYHWIQAANHIEHDRCPICHCNAHGEDCDGTYEWCEHCTLPCEGRRELKTQLAYERHVDFEIKAAKERMIG
jgi:hypothetical protein